MNVIGPNGIPLLKIDEKWSIEYHPDNNDSPGKILRHDEPFRRMPLDNLHVAMFYTLLAERTERAEVESLLRAENGMLQEALDEVTAESDWLRGLLRAERSGAVYVCPECDIAGCKHYRQALKGQTND